MEYQADTRIPKKPSFLVRHWTHVILCTFVLVISFFYGIKRGLEVGVTPANAALDSFNHNTLSKLQQQEIFTLYQLVPGIQIAPMGRDISINGEQAEVFSFLSARNVIQLVRHQRALWEKMGLDVYGLEDPKRSVLFARDPVSKRYFSYISWTTAPSIRKHLVQPAPVQGMISITNGKTDFSATQAEVRGEVPEIPLMPGGHSAAVFRSTDIGGLSYSSLYTLPTRLEGALFYYENELTLAGWKRVGRSFNAERGSASLTFNSNQQDVVLLFSKGPAAKQQTLAFISVMPSMTADKLGYATR